MIRLFFLLGTVLYFSGCVYNGNNTENISKEVVVSKKIYKDVSKEALLEAAKKIFIIANKHFDSNEFIIDSYKNKLEISRVFLGNKYLKANLYVDKWVFEVQQFENETRVILILTRTDATDDSINLDIPDDIYSLFWERIDFLLGFNEKWLDCSSYQSSRLSIYDTTLCNYKTDFVSNDEKVKNIYISQREKKSYTIDKIKTNIFDNPTIESIPDNDEIYTNSESLDDVKIKRTLMEDKIFETKEEKVEIAQEEVSMDENNEPAKPNSEEKIKEEDINAFTKNINNIVNKKE